jgi:hypothetical protein
VRYIRHQRYSQDNTKRNFESLSGGSVALKTYQNKAEKKNNPHHSNTREQRNQIPLGPMKIITVSRVNVPTEIGHEEIK